MHTWIVVVVIAIMGVFFFWIIKPLIDAMS